MSYFDEYLDSLRANLAELRKLLTDLPAAALDWSPGEGVNSIAVLAAHTAGATRYWLGDVLGSRESSRDRDAEFLTHNVDGVDLAARIEAALADVTPIVLGLTLDDLAKHRFSPRSGREQTVGWILTHALTHTAQHVGHAQVAGQMWTLAHPR